MNIYPSAPLHLLRDAPVRAGEPTGSFHSLKSTDRAARAEILHRAFLLWEDERRPENRALAHWPRAETEVMRSH